MTMPYRGAVETTLARCATLQEGIRGLERTLRLPWTPPVEIRAQTYDEACELERRLGARLYELEEELAQRHAEETAIIRPGSGALPDFATRGAEPHLWPVAVAVTLIGIVLVVLLQFLPHNAVSAGTSPSREYHVAGHTKSEPCSIDIYREQTSCDVSVVCKTIERRGHSENCISKTGAISPSVTGAIDFDGEHGIVHLIGDHGETIEIGLTSWR